jgi:hypothetical protein
MQILFTRYKVSSRRFYESFTFNKQCKSYTRDTLLVMCSRSLEPCQSLDCLLGHINLSSITFIFHSMLDCKHLIRLLSSTTLHIAHRVPPCLPHSTLPTILHLTMLHCVPVCHFHPMPFSPCILDNCSYFHCSLDLTRTHALTSPILPFSSTFECPLHVAIGIFS